MLFPLVAVTVIVGEPIPVGVSVSDQWPEPSAMADAVAAAPPAGVSASASTSACGAVVPVTVIDGVVIVVPGAGEVIVTRQHTGHPVRDVAVRDDVGRLEVAPGAEVERQPGHRGLGPGERAGRADRLAVW